MISCYPSIKILKFDTNKLPHGKIFKQKYNTHNHCNTEELKIRYVIFEGIEDCGSFSLFCFNLLLPEVLILQYIV